jgi:HD-like signal output (HDOD) protein
MNGIWKWWNRTRRAPDAAEAVAPVEAPPPASDAGGSAPVGMPAPRPAAPDQPKRPRRPIESSDAELSAVIREEMKLAGQALESAFPSSSVLPDAHELLTSILVLDSKVLRRPPPAARFGLAAAENPETPIATIVSIFEHDPALAQSLMRHSNSAYYACGAGRCETLRDAVQRVGSTGVHIVIMQATVQGMLCRPGGEYQPMVDRVWCHMVRTAPVARALAPRYGLTPDRAFLVGLLHDVGKLAVFDRIAALRTRRRASVQISPAFVTSLLRAVHAPLGAAMALDWGLGADAARAILIHHRDRTLYEDEKMSEVVCLAERADLSLACNHRVDPEKLWLEAQLSGEPPFFDEVLALAMTEGEDSGDDRGEAAARAA